MPSVHSARQFVFIFVCSVFVYEKKGKSEFPVLFSVQKYNFRIISAEFFKCFATSIHQDFCFKPREYVSGSVCLWCIHGIVQTLDKSHQMQPKGDSTHHWLGAFYSNKQQRHIPRVWSSTSPHTYHVNERKQSVLFSFFLFFFKCHLKCVMDDLQWHAWMWWKITVKNIFLSVKNPAIFNQIQELRFHCATRLTASHTHTHTDRHTHTDTLLSTFPSDSQYSCSVYLVSSII